VGNQKDAVAVEDLLQRISGRSGFDDLLDGEGGGLQALHLANLLNHACPAGIDADSRPPVRVAEGVDGQNAREHKRTQRDREHDNGGSGVTEVPHRLRGLCFRALAGASGRQTPEG